MLTLMLMLSTAQPPDPRREVNWHDENLKKKDITYFATPQNFKKLHPGGSIAFYGNKELGYRLLALGRFHSLEEINSEQGIRIAREQAELYGNGQIPSGARMWVGVDMLRVRNIPSIDELDGTIWSTGDKLGLETLPKGRARGCFYIITPKPLFPIQSKYEA